MTSVQAIADETQESNSSFDRLVNSQPILNMLELLSKSGRNNFNENGVWEVCFCALVLHLEPNCKLFRLLEALPSEQDHMDEVDLLNCMANLGYNCRKADSTLEDIDDRLLPGLFIPQNGVPCIVLGRDNAGRLQFYDPISKIISNVAPSLTKNGSVWFFQKFDDSQIPTSRFMRQASGHSWFFALIGRFKSLLLQILVAGFFLNAIALVTPLFIMLVYDRVISADAPATLPMLAVGAILMIGFEWKLRNIRSTGLSWLAGRLDNIVSNKIFSHLIGLPPSLIETSSVSAQVARIKTFEAIRDFFSGSAFLSFLEAPMVIMALGAIWLIAGNLVFVPLGMIFGYLIVFYIIRRMVKISIHIAAKESSARQKFTIETFEKLENIRLNGLKSKWKEKFRLLSGRELMSHFKLSWLGMIAETLGHSLTLIAAVVTIGFGVGQIWAGEMSSGALVASMILVWRVLTPFYSLCTMIPRLEQIRNSILQVNKLMDIKTEREEAASYSRLPKLKGDISFSNVRCRLSEESDSIFQDLSFEAKSGDIVALTGNNGTGKLAVFKLIKAMIEPQEGVVKVDGFDIRQLDASHLRRQIAYVPRFQHFFHGTIIDNLRLGNPVVTLEEIKLALEQANAWDDVCKLPSGLNTFVSSYGDNKITVSLACRLSLARAYLDTSPLLLLDELPNTLLSGKTGARLKEYLAKIKGKRTVIINTYREDFLRIADTIVWLRGSSHPVTGNREEVLNELNRAVGGL